MSRWKRGLKKVNKGRYEAVLKQEPDNREALGKLGSFYFEQKQYNLCESYLNRALEPLASTLSRQQRSVSEPGTLWKLRGYALFEMWRVTYKSMMDEVVVWSHTENGKDRYGHGVAEVGKKNRALRTVVWVPKLLRNSQLVLEAEGGGEAVEKGEKIQNSTRQPNIMEYDLLHRSLDCFIKAATFLENVSDAKMWFKIAVVYRLLGDTEGALSILARLVQDFPSFPLMNEVILMCVILLFETRAYKECTKYLNYLIQTPPLPSSFEVADLEFLLGLIYHDSADTRSAKGVLQAAFERTAHAGRHTKSISEWMRSPLPWSAMARLFTHRLQDGEIWFFSLALRAYRRAATLSETADAEATGSERSPTRARRSPVAHHGPAYEEMDEEALLAEKSVALEAHLATAALLASTCRFIEKRRSADRISEEKYEDGILREGKDREETETKDKEEREREEGKNGERIEAVKHEERRSHRHSPRQDGEIQHVAYVGRDALVAAEKAMVAGEYNWRVRSLLVMLDPDRWGTVYTVIFLINLDSVHLLLLFSLEITYLALFCPSCI